MRINKADNGNFQASSKTLGLEAEQLVRKFWVLFSELRWDEARQLLADDFSAEYHQTREKFSTPDAYIAMNRNYPGHHVFEIIDIVAQGEKVAAFAFIRGDNGQKTFVSGIYHISGGLIRFALEFWGEPYTAPTGREKYVTPLETRWK